MYSYTDICLWNGLRKNKCRIYENIRMDGTTASTYIEEGTKQQYEKARSLGYVRETGRRMKMGEATESGRKESICPYKCWIRLHGKR